MKWLIITRRSADFDTQYLPAHYDFLENIRSEGTLVLSGPFDDSSGGAYVIEAPARTDAHTIASSDPLYVNGCSDFVLRCWQLRELG